MRSKNDCGLYWFSASVNPEFFLKCENFQTLKNWIKVPICQFPQWEDHFSITWGDENEMAIYIHQVGPDCYTLGKCVAVIRKASS